MRIPISCVLWLTAYAITPETPVAAMTSARAAKIPRRIVVSRVWVDGVHRVFHLAGDVHGIERGAHDQGPRPERLRLRNVDRAHGLRIEGLFANVSDEAHDGDPGLSVVERDPLSYGVSFLPELVGEGAVDDRNGGSFEAVELGERAAAEERDSHGGEVIGGRHSRRDLGRELALLDFDVLDPEAARERRLPVEGPSTRGRRGFDAGNGANSPEKRI
jgi:hypothetical protein